MRVKVSHGQTHGQTAESRNHTEELKSKVRCWSDTNVLGVRITTWQQKVDGLKGIPEDTPLK